MGWAFVLLSSPLLVACDDEEVAVVEVTAPTEEAESVEAIDEPELADIPPPSDAQRCMHDRYGVVERMRDALIEGELEQAQAHGRGLAAVAAVDVPAAAEPLREVIAAKGAEVSAASDLSKASLAFGELVLSCGTCHERAHATWTWEVPELPHGDDPATHMGRHRWAVDRMWEGLLVHDADHFDMGARALADAPLLPDEDDSELAALAGRVHALGGDLPDDAGMAPRAARFGQLLTTCADCHRRLRALEESGVR